MATTKKVAKKTTKKPTTKTTSKPRTTSKVGSKAAKTTKTTKPVKKARSRKVAKVESFKLSKEKIPFTSFKVTEQTLYWGILFVYIFALSLWVLSIQINIMNVINSISASIV